MALSNGDIDGILITMKNISWRRRVQPKYDMEHIMAPIL